MFVINVQLRKRMNEVKLVLSTEWKVIFLQRRFMLSIIKFYSFPLPANHVRVVIFLLPRNVQCQKMQLVHMRLDFFSIQ